MCIRDRARTGRAGLGQDLVAQTGLGIDQEHIRVVGRTVLPVSYTHLRAHETVLDLVCRLLLEKKKQILTTTINIRLHYRS